MKIIKQSICTGCPLLCDDVSFKVDDMKITADVACSLASDWAHNASQHLVQSNKSSSDVSKFADVIANRLRQSSAPLITGLNHLSMQAQQLAWQIADITKATIDVTLTKSNRASIYSMQRQGKVTATLGEIANRSDLVVFWFCDPAVTHPRLIERLTQAPASKKKRIVVVGDSQSLTASVADEVFSVNAIDAAKLIREIRSLIRPQSKDKTKDAPRPEPSENAKSLVRLLTNCSYGSWIYGSTGQKTGQVGEFDDVTLTSQSLVRELNDQTCMVSLNLRSDNNAVGGENVLAAFSGFSSAVNLGASIPQHNGSEFAAESLLERGECDFVLLFAGWSSQGELDSLSTDAKKFLAHVPSAIVTSDASFKIDCTQRLVVDRVGVSDDGEVCRLDGVSLGVERLIDGVAVSAEEVLRETLARVTDAG